MMRNKLLFIFLSPFFSHLAFGCKCQTSLSPGDEAASNDIVFIGAVQSIEPKILSRWNLPNESSLRALNHAYLDAQEVPSQARVERLKDTYRSIFRDLPANEHHRAADAKTMQDVTAAFSAALNHGMRVRFHIKTFFKQSEDDDKQTEVDVWNPFGDCGFDFQAGETYLIYAKVEESSGYLFTSSCTRTRRLSDAGEDLAYLYFYKDNQKQSAHLEGYTTSDAKSQAGFDPLHAPQGLKSPVSHAVIELRSDAVVRYTQPGGNGRFTFDGLPEGEYRISAFTEEFPMYRRLLAGPRPLQVKEKSCSHQVFLLPTNQAQ